MEGSFLSLPTHNKNKHNNKIPNVHIHITQCFTIAFTAWDTKTLFLPQAPSLSSPLCLTNHNIVGKYVLMSPVQVDVLPIPKIKK